MSDRPRGVVRSRPAVSALRSQMRFAAARVMRTSQLGPHLRRVTLIGEGLGSFPYAGPDQRIKLLLALPGQDRPHIDGLDTIWDLMALPDEVRPIMRTYTVRHHRPGSCELDIDFLLHEPGGPATRWATQAQPGDEIALFGPAAEFDPPQDTQWHLLAGDDTALPAIGAIVENLRPHQRARVLIEVSGADDEQRFDAAADLEVTWLHRGESPAHESTLLLDAVRGIALPEVPSYFWLAAESSVATGLRRHLVNECGVARDDVEFSGYWRYGRTEADA